MGNTQLLFEITQHLRTIQKDLKRSSLEEKSFWTLEEFASYTGYAESYIHKLTSAKSIPFRKPNGRKLFFVKNEILDWLDQGGFKVESTEPLSLSSSNELKKTKSFSCEKALTDSSTQNQRA